jgi:hypothetical protein
VVALGRDGCAVAWADSLHLQRQENLTTMLASLFAARSPQLPVGDFVRKLAELEIQVPAFSVGPDAQDGPLDAGRPLECAALNFRSEDGGVLLQTQSHVNASAPERIQAWEDSVSGDEWPRDAGFSPDQIVFQADLDFGSGASELATSLLAALGRILGTGVVSFDGLVVSAAELPLESHALESVRPWWKFW